MKFLSKLCNSKPIIAIVTSILLIGCVSTIACNKAEVKNSLLQENPDTNGKTNDETIEKHETFEGFWRYDDGSLASINFKREVLQFASYICETMIYPISKFEYIDDTLVIESTPEFANPVTGIKDSMYKFKHIDENTIEMTSSHIIEDQSRGTVEKAETTEVLTKLTNVEAAYNLYYIHNCNEEDFGPVNPYSMFHDLNITKDQVRELDEETAKKEILEQHFIKRGSSEEFIKNFNYVVNIEKVDLIPGIDSYRYIIEPADPPNMPKALPVEGGLYFENGAKLILMETSAPARDYSSFEEKLNITNPITFFPGLRSY